MAQHRCALRRLGCSLGESTLNGLGVRFRLGADTPFGELARRPSVLRWRSLMTFGRAAGRRTCRWNLARPPLSAHAIRVQRRGAAKPGLSFPRGTLPRRGGRRRTEHRRGRVRPRLDAPPDIEPPGAFSLQGSHLEVQDLNAALGKSEIRRFRLHAELGREGGDLDAAAETAVIHGEDLVPAWPGGREMNAVREDNRRPAGNRRRLRSEPQRPTARPSPLAP